MPLSYEENFTVLHVECDPFGRMTPGAVLRRVQELSTAHCETLGVNEALYQDTHTVFLLSRVSLEVADMPRLGQAVCIRTCAYGVRRAVYYRVTTLMDAEGKTLCQLDSRWLLVDTQSRRILRRSPGGLFDQFDEEAGPPAHAEMEIPAAGPVAHCAQLRAVYSLCDRNGHINNARYADILCDHLPLERLEAGPVRKLLLVYRSEIPLGDAFDLAHATTEDGSDYFVAFTGEGVKSFEGYVRF